VIRIGPRGGLRGHESLARDAAHDTQNAWIPDAPTAELCHYHMGALGRPIGIDHLVSKEAHPFGSLRWNAR